MRTAEGYPEFLSLAGFAAVMDVHVRTVTAWISAGLITVKRGPGPGRPVLIPSAGVAEFLPPRSDQLLCQGKAMELTGLTKDQLDHLRSSRPDAVVRTPNKGYRYLRSAVLARRAQMRLVPRAAR